MILGVGVDIESVSRLRNIRASVRERMINRILTDKEKAYCLGRVDPYPCIVARFCVKEAFVKALGIKDSWSIPFRDVEVLGRPPTLSARGKAKEILDKLGAKKIHISLSHTSDYAVAVVIIEGEA